MSDTKPQRRWFQYSLRALLVFVTLCAILCSWLAVKLQQAKRERETAEKIENLGTVVYDWQIDVNGAIRANAEPPGPIWLRNLLGEDFFQSVIAVAFVEDPQNMDATLEDLRGFSQLQELSLPGTSVTDAGLKHLKGLNQLRRLDLCSTHVTDSGLTNLKGLSQLQELYLDRTQVTDAGVKKLQQALPNCKIEHGGKRQTDRREVGER
jgi:hypothetical protein